MDVVVDFARCGAFVLELQLNISHNLVVLVI